MNDLLYTLAVQTLEVLAFALLPILVCFMAVGIVSSFLQSLLGVREEAIGISLRFLIVILVLVLFGAQLSLSFSELMELALEEL